jgi:hypothetical protein
MRTPESYFLIDLIGSHDLIEDKKAELHKLARGVERLSPYHRDPEAFHEAKSEVAHRLRMIARGITPFEDGKLKLSGPVLETQFQLVSGRSVSTDKKRDKKPDKKPDKKRVFRGA